VFLRILQFFHFCHTQIIASLSVWINLLKAPNNRKDNVLTASLNVKIEGGLKLLAVTTLDVDGCRNAIFAFKGFEGLLNLVTDVSKKWFLKRFTPSFFNLFCFLLLICTSSIGL
jgi:hypothetical protein